MPQKKHKTQKTHKKTQTQKTHKKKPTNHATKKTKNNRVYFVPRTSETTIRFSSQMPWWITEKKRNETRLNSAFQQGRSKLSNVILLLSVARHALPENVWKTTSVLSKYKLIYW